MKHETAAPLLDDYVDGELDAALAGPLEAHVRQCVACRRELEGLRQLLEGAAALPRAIEPARDLWPAISEATGSREADASTGSRILQRLGFFSWSWPTALATAAVVGVLFISTLNPGPSYGPEQAGGQTDMATLAKRNPEAAALLRSLEAECLQGERELAAYDDNGGPVAWMLKQSMPVVDRAIGEARGAWIASPDQLKLARLLTSAYRAKLALQERAIRMASQS